MGEYDYLASPICPCVNTLYDSHPTLFYPVNPSIHHLFSSRILLNALEMSQYTPRDSFASHILLTPVRSLIE